MHAFLISTAAFVVLLGIMVVVHEFGHFAVAKLCGVRVEAFSVGFGPRLFGVKYGDTDYKVCLLPLGGYVKMTGETPDAGVAGGMEETDPSLAADPGAFTSHPRWQRMLIGLAGPVANFILAFVAMACYFTWINESPAFEVSDTRVEWVAPGSQAATAGLQSGDVIRQFAGSASPTWYMVDARASLNLGETVPVDVERNGQLLHLSLFLPAEPHGDEFDVSDMGLYPQQVSGPIDVAAVVQNAPAALAGLQPGDAIESVDGHAFHTVPVLLAYLQSGKGTPISVVVKRKGQIMPPLVIHPVHSSAQLGSGWKLGFEAVPPPMHDQPLPFGRALAKSTSFCGDSSTLILDVLRGIILRRVSISQLSGPVRIAQMAGEAAEMKGWYPKFALASEISLNLGILNLLPFPILDGGLILLLVIESGIRRDINTLVKERIYQAAFVMLVAFAAFIIFNDITKINAH
ncbi:MAG TPA: RIP metalloprotease RseP [Terracidiphilus sp.]|nr:RIP metalloprotease RseP [Terracidiphilus sp.]